MARPLLRISALACLAASRGFDRAFGWKLGAARCEDWAKDWDGTSNGRVTGWDLQAFMKGHRPARRWPDGGGGGGGDIGALGAEDDLVSSMGAVAVLDLDDPSGKVSKVLTQVVTQFETRGVVFNEGMALLQQVPILSVR